MIGIKVERGGSGFYRSAEGIAAHTQLGLERAWWMSAKDIQSTFDKQVLDKSSKTGRIYFRRIKGGRKRRHQASAPGESPAKQPRAQTAISTVVGGGQIQDSHRSGEVRPAELTWAARASHHRRAILPISPP